MSSSRSAEAAAAFARLRADPALAQWQETIRHHEDQQQRVWRDARFMPPAPAAVAAALAAGPPASAADLRAVVHHVIEELAHDIRHGDTSPWRSFWNRPVRAAARPKIENDCRDILTDRLRDRLERYGIPVRRTGTETRSANDRRADMFVIGDGAARLPVEVKRHWNKELWTAVEDQLVDYARSGDSSGHGIYLIFWFGTGCGALPKLPEGGPLPTTPEALQAMLVARLSDSQRETINVVVIDVSEPPRKTKSKPKPKPKARAKPKAKGQAAGKPVPKAPSKSPDAEAGAVISKPDAEPKKVKTAPGKRTPRAPTPR